MARKYGLDVELVGFSGSLLPNDPTANGDLDANVFQHRPFLAGIITPEVITGRCGKYLCLSDGRLFR